jgi:uncharacterized protein YhhL (DUF1145 family)
MKAMSRVGQLLMLVFWLLVASSLMLQMAKPFAQLLQLCGAGMLALHVLEWLLPARLGGADRPWLSLLIFGLLGSPRRPSEPSHA